MGRLMLARHGYGHGEQLQPLSECQFEYTPAGQLAGEIQRIWLTDSNGTPQIQHEYLVQHQYDLLGNRSQSLLPEVGELGLLRYGSGHLHGIALNQQSLISFQRDALHREVERRYDLYPLANPETSPLDPVELIRTQHYDPLGRLQQRSYQGLPGTENGSGEHQPLVALQQRHYHYDALGQLVRIQQPASKNGWHYSYDAQGRLHSTHNDQDPASQQRWWFDAAGNPLPPPHAPQPVAQDWAETVRQRLHEPGFNLLQPEQQSDTAKPHCWPDNQVLFHDQLSYQYDTRGNRIRSHDKHTGITRQYHYDALNQLVAIDQFDDSKQLQRSLYLYDPLGRRLHKQVQHFTIEANRTLTAQGKPASEYYGWDGDRLTMYKQHDHQWHYLYEPDSFTPMLLIRLGSGPELDECQHIIQHNMDMFKDALSMMETDDAEKAHTQMRA